MLEKACRQTRQLNDRFGRELRVSVNLSARQLKEGLLVMDVQSALETAMLPAHLLELELTETALVVGIRQLADVFRKLKSLEVLVAVDNFGTGYFGRAYLGRFPFDVLKLDHCLVNEESSVSRRVVAAFIEMAHRLGLPVVAEGGETEEVLRFLQEASCDKAQGYLIARPMNA